MHTDILIIGSGPAGLQAAIHAARRKCAVVVAGKLDRSALAKAHVENMFGFPGKVNGMEMLASGRKQAESFGARFIEHDVIHLEKRDGGYFAKTDNGAEILAKAVIFAMGVKRNTLKLDRASELVGKGVSYCADCDARFFKGKDVVVIGDGSAAAGGALVLQKYARTVYLVAEKLGVPMEMERELRSAGIVLHEGRKVAQINGSEKVDGVRLDDGTAISAEGIFIELGSKSPVELATSIGVIPDTSGNILVDRSMATAVPGIFACGDVTGFPLQAAKAVGEGCTAGLSAVEYLKSLPKSYQDELFSILTEAKTIAVVGLSPKEDKPSHRVAKYLKEAGYRIIPVNPNATEVLGLKSYPSLLDVPDEIDVVQIFRKPEDVAAIVEDAIRKKAKVVWMQEGITNEAAVARAKEAGLKAVMDRCMFKEHSRMTGYKLF